MKRILFIISVLCVVCACSKEVADGPYVYFANAGSIPDTIPTESTVNFKVTAIGVSSKVNHVQLFVNKTKFFDTTFVATDSITVDWDLNFGTRIKTQNILIQATDQNNLMSSQTKNIFIK